MAENYGMNPDRPVFPKPQVFLSCSTPVRMWLVSFCALLAILQSAWTDSFRSLVLAVVSVIAAIITEMLFLYKSGKTSQIKDGSVVASALVFTLLLPNRISPLYAILGIIFAIAIIKHCFGGLGSNWLNPAAGGWLFIRLSWPGAFEHALEGSTLSLLKDSLPGIGNPGGSPLEILKTGYTDLFSNNGLLETHLRPFLNRSIFSLFNAELPSSYLDLFMSNRPGIIADRGILALLLGSVLIMAFRAGRARIPAVWLLVFVFFTRLAGGFPYGAQWWRGDILFALCSGGTLAAAFFLACDPATGAKSGWSVFGSAIAGGFFAWLFRYPGAEPYGAVISVIFINALLPVIRSIEICRLQKRRAS